MPPRRAAVFMKFKTEGFANGDIFYEEASARALSKYFCARSTAPLFCCVYTDSQNFAGWIIPAVCCPELATHKPVDDSFAARNLAAFYVFHERIRHTLRERIASRFPIRNLCFSEIVHRAECPEWISSNRDWFPLFRIIPPSSWAIVGREAGESRFGIAPPNKTIIPWSPLGTEG